MANNPEEINLKEIKIKENDKKLAEIKKPIVLESVDNSNLIEKNVSYFRLQYKFADKFDIFLIIFACIGSIIAGASMPLISLLLGSAINNFGPDSDKEKLKDNVKVLAINFVLCGFGILLGSFVMFFFWSLVSKRLINKINIAYFEVLLRQEQGYFDQGQKNEHFVTKINQEIKIIENGVKLFYY
jgi:ABC-type multidrug transport system fused ATPase/permease subunit